MADFVQAFLIRVHLRSSAFIGGQFAFNRCNATVRGVAGTLCLAAGLAELALPFSFYQRQTDLEVEKYVRSADKPLTWLPLLWYPSGSWQ